MQKFKDLRKKEPSLTTIFKYTKKVGFSKKIVSKRNEQALSNLKVDRKNLIFKMMTLIKIKKEIIYIDETGFNIDMVPLRGISKKNSKCFIKRKNKSKNITAICAIDSKNIIGLQFFLEV